MKTTLIIASLALSAVAHADAPVTDGFELKDRGDAVEIIAHGMKATRTAIAPIRSRLEVPVTGAPTASRMFPKADGTIVQVDLDGAPSARVVSVKLKYEHNEVVQFARFAQAVQVGDDLHILVPRKLPADGQPAHLPEPTLPTAIVKPAAAPGASGLGPRASGDVQPIAAIAPIMGPQKPTEPKADPKPADPKPAVARTDAPAPSTPTALEARGPKPEAAKAAPATPAKLGGADEPSSPFSMVIAGGLVLCGGAMWVAKKKRKAAAGKEQSIEVIASRSIGGKAKIVWLNAAGRDLVVAVTPQQVRMLHASAMAKPQRETSIGAAQNNAGPSRRGPRPDRTARVRRESIIEEQDADAGIDADDGPAFAAALSVPSLPTATAKRSSSPQISGLLKLREEIPALPARTRLGTPPHGAFAAMPLADDIATDDYEADEMWAKEIRAATMGTGSTGNGGRK